MRFFIFSHAPVAPVPDSCLGSFTIDINAYYNVKKYIYTALQYMEIGCKISKQEVVLTKIKKSHLQHRKYNPHEKTCSL